MEDLHKTKDILIARIKDPIILKTTPTQLRQIRNEIQEEFNSILRQIMDNKKKKKTKKKKIVPPRVYISDSSDYE
jgi:hypothetical protein